MNPEIVGASLLLALVLGALWFRSVKRARDSEPDRFNNSRWRLALIKKTRRQFRGTKWKLREGAPVAERYIDFFLIGELGSFEIICFDRTMKKFMTEMRILEEHEDTTRRFRARNGCLIGVFDDGFSLEFAKNAGARSLLVVHVDDLNVLVGLDKYFDTLPEELTPFELRILEGSFVACMNLSSRFKAARNLEKAIEWARRALIVRYGYSAHFVLFSLLLDNNDMDAAEAVGNEGLSFKPKDSVGFFKGLQKIAIVRGDNAAAITWAERWIAAEPDDALAYDNLASLYERQKNGAAASVAIGKALQLAPWNVGVLRRAAKIALLEGNLSAAFGYAEQWAAQAPNDGGAYEFQADVLLRQKNYDGAKLAIATAMSLQSDNWSFVRKSSVIALDSGDVTAAAKFAEQWVAMASTDPRAYDHMSLVYLRASQYEEASQANAKALELDPANLNIQRRAVDIQNRLGRPPVSVSSTSA